MSLTLKSKNQAVQEWNAEKYAQNSSIQYAKAQEVIESYNFTGNERILDIGCGNGEITALLSQKSTNLVEGIDASTNMIKYAQEKYKNIKNLSFNAISADKFDVNAQYDLIFSFNCLHWVYNKQAVFDNIYKALKPQGKCIFFFSILPPSGFYPMVQIASDLKKKNQWKKYFLNHQWPWYHESQNTIQALIIKSGLKINSLTTHYKFAEFENREKMIDHLLALSWLNNLPENLQKQFVQELVDEYISQQPLNPEHGIYSYSAYQLFGILEKS